MRYRSKLLGDVALALRANHGSAGTAELRKPRYRFEAKGAAPDPLHESRLLPGERRSGFVGPLRGRRDR
jgi:hypothetical protein